MKKYLLVLLQSLLITGIIFAEGEPEATEIDYLKLSWEKLVEQAKIEGTLTMYCAGDQEFWQGLGGDFKEKYGIDVSIVQEAGESIVKRALEEKDQPEGSIDAMLVTADIVRPTIEAGLFYGPLLDSIPNGSKLDPRLSETQAGVPLKGYLVPIARNQTGFLYDPEKVSSAPQTWEELVEWIEDNPKDFAFSDPAGGDTGQAFVQMAIFYLCDGPDLYAGDTELDISKTTCWSSVWNWLLDKRDSITITSSNSQSLEKLAGGEISLTAAYDTDVRSGLKKGLIPGGIKFYLPKMGMPGGGSTVGVLKNSPHKATAILWASYLTEIETQTKIESVIGSMTRSDARDSLIAEDARRKFGISWLPAPYIDHLKSEFTRNVISE